MVAVAGKKTGQEVASPPKNQALRLCSVTKRRWLGSLATTGMPILFSISDRA